MSFSVEKLYRKAGIELLPGKNYPRLNGRGVRIAEKLGKLNRALHELIEEVNAGKAEDEAEKAELAGDKAKLAGEKADLIGKLALAEHRLHKRQTAERLMVHGLSREDANKLSGEESGEEAGAN